MKTSELIEFFTTQPFTDTQGYNLIVGDLFEIVPPLIEEIKKVKA